MATTLQVRKDALDQTRLVTGDDAALGDGQVRVRVERFSLTANNITYAAFGESMNYWQFFPTGSDGWGIVPVWGFGTVVQSLHPGVAVGERLWGYWPMASHAVLQPARVTARGFSDATPHRASLHAVYNNYVRTAADPLYTAESEDVQAILRPLFMTSWLIDDFLADNEFFGARTLLLSSASSKTAYGTAWRLAQREGLEVVGLTSARNRAFCEQLGCYSRVLAYEELDQLGAGTPCVYIDFAGDAPLRRRIHERFTALRHSCAVGGTHVTQLGGGKDLPGPRPTLFFAPAQVKKRQADWGAEVLGQRLQQAWSAFSRRAADPAQPWLRVRQHLGMSSTATAYAEVLAGADPRSGHVVILA